ncbi:SNF2 family N-terminal domain-containing protein [Cladorrhinum sp. PSN259]|nr:SNF2 family N-terminal domain-containing protein [Cladorrhinum sp. PSN259]
MEPSPLPPHPTFAFEEPIDSQEAGRHTHPEPEPRQAEICGTLQPPKRRRDFYDVPSSPKRPRGSPDDSDLDCSTPGSRTEDLIITSVSESPVPSLHRRYSHDMEHSLGDPSAMDWEPHYNKQSDTVICYGAICEAKALFHRKADVNKLCQTSSRFHHVLVEASSGGGYALSSTHNGKRNSAQLDSVTCRALQKLQSLGQVKFEAVIESAKLSLGMNAPSEKGFIVSLSVNVYGPLEIAEKVGLTLSSLSVFLQHPFSLGLQYEYYNPQMYWVGGAMENLTHLVGMTEKDFYAKAISDEVEGILSSLDGTSSIIDLGQNSTEYSEALNTSSIMLPNSVRVPLQNHQLTALAFIRQREHHQNCQNTHKTLRHILNFPSDNDSVHSFERGGILADAMGLGKTLTMISAIIDTLEESKKHLHNTGPDEEFHPSRATLIIVSSMQGLNQAHLLVREDTNMAIYRMISPNTLRTYIFHGQSRAKNPADLDDYDIVLTTYGILCADFKARRVLQRIVWFRIVLDEAHWIRNQSSKQFKAAQALTSMRRWCVTGTPIHNSLDDLVSLLSFLHFEPFCRQSVFQRYVIGPLKADIEKRSFPLRSLLSAICLRRDEKLLQLPQPIFERLSVVLGDDERRGYNAILKQCQQDMDARISSREKIKRYGILFAAMMKLRRLCNHGAVFTYSDSKTPTLADHTAVTGVEEAGCEWCNGVGEDKLELADGEICPQCGSDPSLVRASNLATSSAGGASQLTQAVNVEASIQQAVSTKVQTIMKRLKEQDCGAKSLVFSCWITTLDLLERHMREAGINCLRIDGRVSHGERLRILSRFNTTDVPVLLMTIQTGAVGLNITVASHVHIVEPQWNPSVEEQAIARVVRIGQTQTVTVIRYVVKNSVEENIVNIQKRKRSLTKFTLDGTSDDGSSGSLDDLKFILDFGSV